MDDFQVLVWMDSATTAISVNNLCRYLGYSKGGSSSSCKNEDDCEQEGNQMALRFDSILIFEGFVMFPVNQRHSFRNHSTI